jgi:hypothetical protein
MRLFIWKGGIYVEGLSSLDSQAVSKSLMVGKGGLARSGFVTLNAFLHFLSRGVGFSLLCKANAISFFIGSRFRLNSFYAFHY